MSLAARRRALLPWLAVLSVLAWPALAPAQLSPPAPPAPLPTVPSAATLRQQEITQCLPGEQQTWRDGRDRPAVSRPLHFAYRHLGAPAWFSEAQVLAMVQRAATAWSACGVPVRVSLVARGEVSPEGSIPLLWSETGSRGQFGLANVGARSLSLGPGLFGLLRQRNPAYPAEETLQMVLSHEMGHFFGLMAHSRRCVDVMSYYDNGQGQRCQLRDPRSWGVVPEYRATLPTACDIERCKALNR